MKTVTVQLTQLRAAYLEVPGLRLNAQQAECLCGIERALCQPLLDALVDARFLCVKSDGTYARASDGEVVGTPAATPVRQPGTPKEQRMPKEVILTDKAPNPVGAYSQAVKAGGLVFVSAQGPSDAATRQMCGETIQDQTRQCLKNVEAILRAAGSSLDKVVSTTFTLAEIQDFRGMDEEWGKWFPTDPPAREGSVLPIPLKGMKIAVSAIAEA